MAITGTSVVAARKVKTSMRNYAGSHGARMHHLEKPDDAVASKILVDQVQGRVYGSLRPPLFSDIQACIVLHPARFWCDQSQRRKVCGVAPRLAREQRAAGDGSVRTDHEVRKDPGSQSTAAAIRGMRASREERGSIASLKHLIRWPFGR
jgi:hypothetical protein